MQPNWQRRRKSKVWWNRFASGVFWSATLFVLALLLAGCADDQGAAALSGIAVVPVSKTDDRIAPAERADETTVTEATDSEALISKEDKGPSSFGATVEIDEFFFAPIGFPGFGAVSVNCNLDDDPYGACL